jgi:predicted amidophosphoribosyltransferase
VLRAKGTEAGAAEVAAIFRSFAESIPVTRPPDLVLSVPPAPDEEYDRFAEVRRALATAWGAESQGSEALRMCYAMSNYKHMSHDERAAANVGRFEAETLNGEHVVLIDDVLTSGGQSDACRVALSAAGASQVTVVALTVTQDNLPEPCPNCGANLRVFVRRSDGKRFVGCSAWRVTGCTYTRDI